MRTFDSPLQFSQPFNTTRFETLFFSIFMSLSYAMFMNIRNDCVEMCGCFMINTYSFPDLLYFE